MAEEEPRQPNKSNERNIELTNIYGKRFQLSLQDIANGRITLGTSESPRPDPNSQIFVAVPENNETIPIENASCSGLHRHGPQYENIYDENTRQSTPDSFEFRITMDQCDSGRSSSAAKSEEINLGIVYNDDTSSQSAAPSGVSIGTTESDYGDDYSESLSNFLREQERVPALISPLSDSREDDFQISYPSPDQSSISSGRLSASNANGSGSPRPTNSRQPLNEFNNDDLGNQIPAMASREYSARSAEPQQDSADADSPIRSPGLQVRRYSAEGARPKYKPDNSDDLARPSGSRDFNRDDSNNIHNADISDSLIHATSSMKISSEDTKEKQNSDDSDTPMRSPGERRYSTEGAIPKYKLDDPGCPTRSSGCHFYIGDDDSENNFNDRDSPIAPYSLREFSTGDVKRKHSSDESVSPECPVDSENPDNPINTSTLHGSPSKIRKTQFGSPSHVNNIKDARSPIHLQSNHINPQKVDKQCNHVPNVSIVDYNKPSTSRQCSSSNEYSPNVEQNEENDNGRSRLLHSSNSPTLRLRHIIHPSNINKPPSFRNSSKVWTDIVLMRNDQQFHFTFRLIENYGHQQVLSLMCAYYDDQKSMLPSCVEANGITTMRTIWDLALSKNSSVGVFLDNGPNKDLILVGVDILLLIKVESACKNNTLKDLKHLFGFLCIHPDYRGFGLGKILMEIRSETERELDLVTPDSGGDKQSECMYDEGSSECLYEEDDEEEEEEEKEKEVE